MDRAWSARPDEHQCDKRGPHCQGQSTVSTNSSLAGPSIAVGSQPSGDELDRYDFATVAIVNEPHTT